MGKISLRHYNEEIDVLIDEGNYKTAIEYAKHILTIYPKHADTYRLLGKAFLESERFTDAIDIFQRLLSCIPNDYIAHIGMSVIREDEANLDAAIFHMERAYEVQPTNQTLLKELKRLYGLRDGIEPSKLRLTTGALAKMYAHGDLYSQAIAELLTALVEDEKRPDLMILLAEMYYKSNQIAETEEVCTSILENLPYCFVANDLLARIRIQDNRDTEALQYLSRLYEIDPYIKYSDFPNENPNDVLADEVLIDSYEFQFSDNDDEDTYQPVQLHNTEELLINDWQNSFTEQINEDEIESLESQDSLTSISDDLPDWLRTEDEIRSQLNPNNNIEDIEGYSENNDETFNEKDSSSTFDLFNSLASDVNSDENIEESNDEIELDNWMDELKESPSEVKNNINSEDDSDWLKQLGAIGEYSENVSDSKEIDDDNTLELNSEDKSSAEFNLDSFLNDLENDNNDNQKEDDFVINEIESINSINNSNDDDSDWLNNIMNLSSDESDDDQIESDNIQVSGLNEELKGIVDEGNEAEEWLNSMAAISDEEFNSKFDEIEEEPVVDKSPTPVKSANLDWLDEMKKEAVASINSQKSSEDALNLLGDLGILDDIELENEANDINDENILSIKSQKNDNISTENHPDEDSKSENSNQELSESLSWLDSLASGGEISDDSLMLDDDGEKEEIALENESTSDELADFFNKVDETSATEEGNLSESLSWLDSLASGGEISDDSLILDDDEQEEIGLESESASDELADFFDKVDETSATKEGNLSESLSWLDSLASGGEISDDSLILDDDEQEEIGLESESASDELADFFDKVDETSATEEGNLSESLSWLDSLASGGEISDDSLMLDDDEQDEIDLESESASNELADIFDKVDETSATEEGNLSESLSWLDSLASGGEISDDDLVINNNQPEDSQVPNSTNKEMEWLSGLEDEDSTEDEFSLENFKNNNEETPLPSTIIEEDEEQRYNDSIESKSSLSDSMAWLDSLDSDSLSDDQLISSNNNENIPATIIEETIEIEDNQTLSLESDSDNEDDLSWLEELENNEGTNLESSTTYLEDSLSNSMEEIIEDDELEKLQDTASWKNSLTTDEEYSEEEINHIEENDEKYKAYIEESPEVSDVSKATSNSSWLDELEKQSALSSNYDESAEADTDWLAQLEDEQQIDATDDSYSLEKSLNEGKNWVEDIDLEKSQPISNNLSEEIPEWLSALSVAEKNWDESSNEELSKLAENTSAAWAPEFSSKEENLKENKTTVIEQFEDNGLLDLIKEAIKNKDIDIALNHIVKLIHKNESIEELIQIMEDVLPHDPMNIKLIQTLGDAELKSNRLEKAMEYYTKAEKLIR